MKILLIYNKQAGAKKAGKVLPDVLNYCKSKNIIVDLRITEYPWHGIELVKNTFLKDYSGVVASGGDGTLFEVVNGYQQNTGKNKPALGLIPNGTGNAFAKELKLKSFEWQKAIDLIAANKQKWIDVAHLKTEEKDYYFINMLGVGWSADVGRTVIRLKFLGEVSYLIGVLYHIVFLKSARSVISLDDRKIERDAVFIQVGNTRYTGSTFMMSPDAVEDDGFLEVVVLNKLSRLKILRILPTVFTGKHIFEKEIEVFKAKKITITTNPVKSLVPDGELFGRTPVEVECLPKALPFFWQNGN